MISVCKHSTFFSQMIIIESSLTSHRLRSLRPYAVPEDDVINELTPPTSHVIRSDQSKSPFRLYCRRALLGATQFYGLFFVGLFVTLFITEVAKLTVGRLRPHFLAVCQPDFARINCSDGYNKQSIVTNTFSVKIFNFQTQEVRHHTHR